MEFPENPNSEKQLKFLKKKRREQGSKIHDTPIYSSKPSNRNCLVANLIGPTLIKGQRPSADTPGLLTLKYEQIG